MRGGVAAPWRRRIWWITHGLLVVVVALALIAFSPPGINFLLLWPLVPLAAAVAISWVAMLGGELRSKRPAWQRWIAPVVGVALIVALCSGLPRDVRWAMTRPAFEDVVATLPAPAEGIVPEWNGWSEQRRVGTYAISRAVAVTGGYLFTEDSGAFFDLAGVAYLPFGPDGMAEDGYDPQRFRAMGGAWFGWTDTW